MRVQRIVGCAVMALLVVSVALPAMCGACMDFAAKPRCGETHDAGTSASEQFSIVLDAHCGDCGDRSGISAKETGRHAPASESMFLDCARRICVGAAEQTAAIYRDGVDAHRVVGDRPTSRVAAEIAGPAMRTVHLNVSGNGKRSSGNSAYQPLSVTLKI